jgi:hypothetical protein
MFEKYLGERRNRGSTDMRIVVDHDEPRVIALVRHMHGNGRSLREITSELHLMGVVTRGGHPLRLGQIWNILRAPAY